MQCRKHAHQVFQSLRVGMSWHQLLQEQLQPWHQLKAAFTALHTSVGTALPHLAVQGSPVDVAGCQLVDPTPTLAAVVNAECRPCWEQHPTATVAAVAAGSSGAPSEWRHDERQMQQHLAATSAYYFARANSQVSLSWVGPVAPNAASTIAAGQRHYSTRQERHRQPRKHKQQQQQQQCPEHHYPRAVPWQPQQQPTPAAMWRNIREPAIVHLLNSAMAAQQPHTQRVALLHAALQSMLQQLRDMHPGDVAALLHCFEVGGAAVPLPAMQQLLQHLDSMAAACSTPVVLRVLRSASFAVLSASSSSSTNQTAPAVIAADSGIDTSSSIAGLQAMPIQRLLQHVLHPTGTRRGQLNPAQVPHLLRCVSILQSQQQGKQQQQQQQQLPTDLIDKLVSHWGLTSSSSISSSTGSTNTNLSGVGRHLDLNSSSSGSFVAVQRQRAQQAAIIAKALYGLNHQVAGPELQLLLQPLLDMLNRARSSSTAGSSRTTGPPGPEQGAAAAVEAAAWLPPLLLALHRLDMHGSVEEQQRAQVLSAASSTLRALAAAATAPHTSSWDEGAPSPLVLARCMQDITKTLAAVQRASPIRNSAGLVDELTHALLAAGAPDTMMVTLLSSFAALNLSPSLDSMRSVMSVFCTRLQQQQQGQHSVHLQQEDDKSSLPQEARFSSSSSSHVVSQLLWSTAQMGFSLCSDQLQLLLQQLLTTVRAPVTLHVTQALWALAHMGTPLQDQQQPQQQQGAGSGAGLTPAVADLACQLLNRTLQEHQAAAHSVSAGTKPPTSPGASSAGKAGDSGIINKDDMLDDEDGAGSVAGMYGHTAWQLSLASWAAAMCDLQSCKDTVLSLCSILAQPSMWSALRRSELVQLVGVHLWLSGNYQWSSTGGLAAVLSQDQLQHLRAAKVLQTIRTAGAGMSQWSGTKQQQGTSDTEDVLLSLQPHMQEVSHLSNQCLPVQTAAGAAGRHAAARASAGTRLGTSVSQVAVWKVLQGLKEEVQSAQLEEPTPDQLFNVDILVTSTSGQQLAVEFDGPHHFAVMVPSGPQAADATAAHGQQEPKQQQQQLQLVPVRRVLFRNAALAARGYAVVCVPYTQWTKLQSKGSQRKYLRQLLAAALQ